jgi:hypothetical protein
VAGKKRAGEAASEGVDSAEAEDCAGDGEDLAGEQPIGNERVGSRTQSGAVSPATMWPLKAKPWPEATLRANSRWMKASSSQ